jgi:HEAT repeat protein
MNFEKYRQSILCEYRSLQNRYVSQDVEDFQPLEKAHEMLFAERIISPCQSQSVEINTVQQPVSSLSASGHQKIEEYKVLDGLIKFAEEHVLLVGKPGSGKTTALQKLLIEEVQRSQTLTILIEMKGFETSVLDLAYAFIEKHHLGLSLEELQRYLTQNKCLLLIDGLNELPSDEAQTDTKRFIDEHGSCRIVASTRATDLGGDFDIQKKLELRPLSPKQIRHFLKAYLSDDTKIEAMQQQLQPRMKTFQETPLLLLMLCAVFRKYEQIPKNLGLAFREFARIYDDEYKSDLGKINYCRHLLGHLAYKMLTGKEKLSPLIAVKDEDAIYWLSELSQVEDTYTWAKDWLSFLRRHHLLQRRSDGKIEFQHQLWQEYYAAEYLVEHMPKLEDDQIKHSFLNLVKWTAPMKLVVSLIGEQEKAVRIVRLGLEVDLLLGAQLVGSVDELYEKQTIKSLITYPLPIQWQRYGSKPWLIAFAKPLLQLLLLKRAKLSSVSSFLFQALKSPYHMIRDRSARIVFGIDNGQYPYELVSLLGDSHKWVSMFAYFAFERVESEQVFPVLIKGLSDPDKSVRKHAALLLGRKGDEDTLPVLILALNDSDIEVRSSVFLALRIIGTDRAISALKKTLTVELNRPNKKLRREAVEAFGWIGDADVASILTTALSDPDKEVRRSAVKALGKIGSKDTVPLLENMLRSRSSKIRSSTVKALGRIGGEQAISALLEAMDDSSHWVRGMAATALGQTKSERAVPKLISALHDTTEWVRDHTIEALGQIKSDQAIPALIEILNNSERRMTCSKTIKALEEIGGEQVVPLLKAALVDSDSRKCRNTVQALGMFKDRQSVPDIIGKLSDPNVEVRCMAAEALSWIGDEQAVIPLVNALQDKDKKVRRRIAEALRKLGNEEASSSLATILDDKDRQVRKAATEAISEIGNEKVVSELLNILRSKDERLRRQAATSLAKIGSPETISYLWSEQFSAGNLYGGDDYTRLIETIQNRCRFYNYSIYQEGVPLATLLSTCCIPPVEPFLLQADFKGSSIGSININSKVSVQSIGTQVKRFSSFEEST